MDYPHMLITTSLSDNRVFDEPLNLPQNLEYKTDNNLLLLRTEMNAGHGENPVEMVLWKLHLIMHLL